MIFRVYFNRKREAPQVWSIDEGDQSTEVNVINFRLGPWVTAEGEYNGQRVNDTTPSALMLVEAKGYRIVDGIAVFF